MNAHQFDEVFSFVEELFEGNVLVLWMIGIDLSGLTGRLAMSVFGYSYIFEKFYQNLDAIWLTRSKGQNAIIV